MISLGETHKLTMSKKGEFTNEEIDCMVNFWKTYAVAKKNELSIEDKLNELGVVLHKDNSEWTWDRLVGYEKAKIELQETIVSPYNDQDIYNQMVKLTRTREESIIPRAVLLEGPPGTGKTTAARIIANDSGVPLVYIPLEKIMSVFYSGSSSKLSAAFDLAYEFEKAIVFIDELDALAGTDDGRIHEETKRMISVLQRRLDGFESKEGILVLGATNKVDSFVAPILNRFSRIITFGLPEFDDRTALFQYYAKQLSEDEVKILAEKSADYCCRDIRDICADAERIWIKRIKDQQLEITPPGVLIYQKALKHKTPIKAK